MTKLTVTIEDEEGNILGRTELTPNKGKIAAAVDILNYLDKAFSWEKRNLWTCRDIAIHKGREPLL